MASVSSAGDNRICARVRNRRDAQNGVQVHGGGLGDNGLRDELLCHFSSCGRNIGEGSWVV